MSIDDQRAEDLAYLKKHTKVELLEHITKLNKDITSFKNKIDFLARCQVKAEDRVMKIKTTKQSFAVNAEEVRYEGDSETGWLVLTTEGIGTVAIIPGREVISVHNVLAADVWDLGHNRDDLAKVQK